MIDREHIIRNWFKDHQLLIEGDWHIWKRPDTGFYAVRYLIINNTLIVLGDLGSAIYTWSSPISFEWLARCNHNYFASKCEASESGRFYEDWDTEQAQRYLREWKQGIEENGENSPKVDEIFKNAMEDINTEGEWFLFLHEYGHELFGADYIEMSDIGKVVSLRCEAHLIGIKMMCERMEKKGVVS